MSFDHLIISLVGLDEPVDLIEFLRQLVSVFDISIQQQVCQSKEFLFIILPDESACNLSDKKHHFIIVRIITHHRNKCRIIVGPEYVYGQCIAHCAHIDHTSCRTAQASDICMCRYRCDYRTSGSFTCDKDSCHHVFQETLVDELYLTFSGLGRLGYAENRPFRLVHQLRVGDGDSVAFVDEVGKLVQRMIHIVHRQLQF